MLGQLVIRDRHYPINPITVLGSDRDCSVFLEHPQIADRHARIEAHDDRIIIRDLRSQTGTYVNGARIVEAILTDGDLINLGDETILFSAESPASTTEFSLKSRNPAWSEQLQQLAHVCKTDHAVLILGESGTGKDVLAQKVHEHSHRNAGPFVSVNCSALTETLIESELFGHVKGAFTGATQDRKGAFEAARGGTLFLDEIGDLSPHLQAKLLRALENEEIRPVGSDRTCKTDVRIIAATHQNIAAKIQDKEFRSDLYYRLNVVSVHAPALRDRPEDFDDLIYYFAKKMRVRFSYLAIENLKTHTWPGNIRELKNLVTRASARFPKIQIDPSHLSQLMDHEIVSFKPSPASQSLPVIKELEKQMIMKRLEIHQGNQRRAAVDLGMPKSTLNDRIRYYQINVDQFKLYKRSRA